MSKIVLYGSEQSRAARIVAILEELGVPYEKHKLDLGKGEHKKPEFLAINPNGKVPALTVDGAPMFESLAIFLYLADRFGVEKGSWPKNDPKAHLDLLSWCVWDTVELGGTAMRWLMATSERVPKEMHNEAAGKAALAELHHLVDLLDKRLGKGPWLLGDRFSLADAWIGFSIAFFKRVGFELDKHATTSAWYERLAARPATQKAWQPW